MPLPDSGLLLLGHGSTLNADSSAPTYLHAEELRRREIFAEVQVGFWKEEPNFRQCLRQMTARRIYVVPNFISSGYFTEQIIPRELGLEGPVTHSGEQEIIYCQPVGLHSSMTEALLRGAAEVVQASSVTMAEPEKRVCLFICGHGTSFNDNSTKIIQEQAAIIRATGRFADCQAVLMEQKPFVTDWRTLTNCPDVIVMPFFISDGLHSYEDIPVLLGLPPGPVHASDANPHTEGNRRLWYGTAIGTGKFMADVILAQVAQAESEYPDPTGEVALSSLEKNTIQGPCKIGQVQIDEQFNLTHEADAGIPVTKLKVLASLEDLRDWIRFNGAGRFRPLRAAPDLRSGWIYHARSEEGVTAALDHLYPAEVANGQLWKNGNLPVTPWRETAERQTGRFRVVRELQDDGVRELVETYCQLGCLKQRLWSPAAQLVQERPGEIPLLCPEACNFLVGKAREKIKGEPGD